MEFDDEKDNLSKSIRIVFGLITAGLVLWTIGFLAYAVFGVAGVAIAFGGIIAIALSIGALKIFMDRLDDV